VNQFLDNSKQVLKIPEQATATGFFYPKKADYLQLIVKYFHQDNHIGLAIFLVQ
jgi:hypothetical protein